MANKRSQLELDSETRTLHDAPSLAKKAEADLEKKLIKEKAATERFANGQVFEFETQVGKMVVQVSQLKDELAHFQIRLAHVGRGGPVSFPFPFCGGSHSRKQPT